MILLSMNNLVFAIPPQRIDEQPQNADTDSFKTNDDIKEENVPPYILERIEVSKPTEVNKKYPHLIEERIIPQQVKEISRIKKTEILEEEKKIDKKIKILKSQLERVKETAVPEKTTALINHWDSLMTLAVLKLDKLEANAYANEFISDSEAQIILTEINTQRTTIKNIQKETRNINPTTPIDALSTTAKKLSPALEETKDILNRHSNEFTNYRLENIISKFTLLDRRLGQVINELKAKNVYINEILTLQAVFEKSIDNAKIHLEIAKSASKNEDYITARQEYKQAIQSVKSAAVNLGKLTSQLKKHEQINFGIKKEISLTRSQVAPANLAPGETKSISPPNQKSSIQSPSVPTSQSVPTRIIEQNRKPTTILNK